jgi:hypothetical protein
MALYGLLCLLPVWSDVFRGRVVPDLMTWPLTGIAAIMLLAGPGRLIHLLAFVAVWLGFYLVTSAGKMGWGDLKLMLPLAALAGANFLIVVFAAFVCSLPLSLRTNFRRRMARHRGQDMDAFDQMAPFGPGAVAGAHLVWLAMGLPLWVGAIWLAGWIIVVTLGVVERRMRPPASPERVRTWAASGRTGTLDDVAGRSVGWLQKKAIMQSLLDDDHWREAHLQLSTIQPLGEGASSLAVTRSAGRWDLSLTANA